MICCAILLNILYHDAFQQYISLLPCDGGSRACCSRDEDCFDVSGEDDEHSYDCQDNGKNDEHSHDCQDNGKDDEPSHDCQDNGKNEQPSYDCQDNGKDYYHTCRDQDGDEEKEA